MCILKQKVAHLLIKEIIMIKIKINKNKLKSKTVKRKYMLKKQQDVPETTNNTLDSGNDDKENERFQIYQKTKAHFEEKPYVDIFKVTRFRCKNDPSCDEDDNHFYERLNETIAARMRNSNCKEVASISFLNDDTAIVTLKRKFKLPPQNPRYATFTALDDLEARMNEKIDSVYRSIPSIDEINSIASNYSD